MKNETEQTKQIKNRLANFCTGTPEFKNSWQRRYDELENAFDATKYSLEDVLLETLDIPNQRELISSIGSYLFTESYDPTYLTNAIESLPVADWLQDILNKGGLK